MGRSCTATSCSDEFRRRPVIAQAAQDLLRDGGPGGRVAVEMADEIFIEEKCRWLSGIVQQCRQPERLLGRNAVHNGQRVCPDIARMMRIILPEALTGGKLRDELEQHIGEFLQQRSSLPSRTEYR